MKYFVKICMIIPILFWIWDLCHGIQIMGGTKQGQPVIYPPSCKKKKKKKKGRFSNANDPL